MDPIVILAAGLGTRLRPLTDECPKPLVPVGDAPMIHHVVHRVRALGARVAVNAHHHLDAMRAWAKAANVALSEEPAEPLGTAGGVTRLRELVGAGSVWIHNGDIDAPSLDAHVLHAALASVKAHSLALLVVAPKAAGEGNVGLVGTRIVRLRHERFAEEESGGEFLGIHWLSGGITLPDRGCLVGDVYLPALRAGAHIEAMMFNEPWRDVGSIDGYLESNLAWLARRGERNYVGKGAHVHALCTHVIAGAGANVTAPSERVVVWPGAKLESPLADAVVTLRSVVRASARSTAHSTQKGLP